MSAALERESNLVIVPRYSRERRRRILEVTAARRNRDDRPETNASIGAKLGLTADQVERALTCWSVILSLDAPARAESKRSLADILAAPVDAEPETVALSAELSRRAGTAIAALPERQRAVLTLRFGLGGEEPASLGTIAEVLGLSRERIRQIEGEALS